MPAHRKPAPRRVNTRPQRALVAVEPVTVVMPDPPRGWLKETVEAWSEFWGSEVAQALTPPDHSALTRLFWMRNEQQRAFKRYKADPYVEGSQGQPVANPALDDALKLERAVVALEDRLGLSPKARAQLGLAFGQAKLTAAELNRRVHADDKPLEVEGWEASDSGV